MVLGLGHPAPERASWAGPGGSRGVVAATVDVRARHLGAVGGAARHVDIEIVDVFGRRVVTVQAGETVNVKATGDLLRPFWVVSPAAAKLAIGEAAAAAGTSTPSLGTTSPSVGTTAVFVPVQMFDGTVAFIATWA